MNPAPSERHPDLLHVLAHPLVNDVFRQMTFNHFPYQTVYRATDSSNLL